MSDLVIDVRDLRKMYGDFAAVDGFSMDVRAGEVYALLGPNGAGKTTAVDILVGVRQRTSGDVTVLGDDPAHDKRGWRNRLGVVPQVSANYLNLSVQEIVTHFASYYSDPLDPRRVIDMVGLTKKKDAKSTELSGGQLRRLDVAVGVVGKPDLIFLDEPTTGLDPEARREAWELVDFFRDIGATTVLTTHYLDEAEHLADRVGVIIAGKLEMCGTVSELGQAIGTRTVVQFEATDVPTPVALEQIATVERVAEPKGVTQIRCETDRPTAVVSQLTAWAHAQDLDEIPGLSVMRPTLEDTYLRLVQKSNLPSKR